MATSATAAAGGSGGGNGGLSRDPVRGHDRVDIRVTTEKPKRPKHKNVSIGEPRKSVLGKIVRGVTCGIATTKKKQAIVRETGDPSAKIPATLDEHIPKIVHGGEMSFSTQAGIAVREKCPLDVHKWAKVPVSAKNAMCQFLATSHDMDFEDSEFMRIVDHQLQNSWRSYRNDLRRIYVTRLEYGETVDEIRAKQPQICLLKENWNAMIDYWQTETFQTYSEKMKQNRSKQMFPSSHGGKSLVDHRLSQLDPETNNSIGPIELFRRMHYRAGKWANPEAEKEYNNLVQMRDNLITQASASGESSPDVAVIEDQVTRHIRKSSSRFDTGFGRARRQKDMAAGSSSRTSLRKENEALRKELDQVKSFMKKKFGNEFDAVNNDSDD